MPCTRSLGLLGIGLSPGKQEEHTLLILIVKGRGELSARWAVRDLAQRFDSREAEAAWTCYRDIGYG